MNWCFIHKLTSIQWLTIPTKQAVGLSCTAYIPHPLLRSCITGLCVCGMSAHLAVISICRDNSTKQTHSLPFPTDSSKGILRETGFWVNNDVWRPVAELFYPQLFFFPYPLKSLDTQLANAHGNSGFCYYYKLLLSNRSGFTWCPQNSASTSLGIPRRREFSTPWHFAIFKAGSGMFVELPLQKEIVTSKHSSKEIADAVLRFLPSMPSSRAKSLLPFL